MGCSRLLTLGLVLHVARCLETVGLESVLESSSNVTALLGRDVYLTCQYRGQSPILSAEWKRKVRSESKAKRLAGFVNGEAFSREDVSLPDSLTNLTVQMRVSSVKAEGEYVCEFQSEEEYFFSTVFVTVQAQPEVQALVQTWTINTTHYQTVSCSAAGGRPSPQISWLVAGSPPSHVFTVNTSQTLHSNGTSTLSSFLHFPTHLQHEDSVSCVVRHPALPEPVVLTVGVDTYTRPNVSIGRDMVQEGGGDFWVVSCLSSGGRPDTDVSLALNGTEERENDTNWDPQSASVRLSVTQYEGYTVTCVFDHPTFTHKESRVVTLPTLYLSGVQIQSEKRSDAEDYPDKTLVELQEGQTDAVISLRVAGNLPRFTVICTKDDGPLPDSVQLIGSSLVFQQAVERQHAGLYQCFISYHHLETTANFTVAVKPRTTQLVPPTIRFNFWREDGRLVVECSADDAVPAANVSWISPEGVSRDFWFNSTSCNGSHSVRGVLLLPACSPQELNVECVINHPAFEEPQNRSITLPLCARPNISVALMTEWKDGLMYWTVNCSADSGAPAADVTWNVGNTDAIVPQVEWEVGAEGLVSVRSSVRLPSSLHADQNLTCTVKHPSLEEAEKREIHIPMQKAPVVRVSVEPPRRSALWVAVCDCIGEGIVSNLSWILPENVTSQTRLSSGREGQMMTVRQTYEFPLARHEGGNLTCVYQHQGLITVKKTLHIPKYYISHLRVLNHTTPLKSRYEDQTLIQRLTLYETHHNEKILLQVQGNVPEYNLTCLRSDGSHVPVDGNAVVLETELTDGGRFSCSASFYHHQASVIIEVEVRREDQELLLLTLLCASSASVLILVLAVLVCVCRNRSSRAQRKDSLSAFASLMPDPPSSSHVNKAAAEKHSEESAHLVSFSIIIDVKSKV